MLTEIYIEALLVDEDLADQAWDVANIYLAVTLNLVPDLFRPCAWHCMETRSAHWPAATVTLAGDHCDLFNEIILVKGMGSAFALAWGRKPTARAFAIFDYKTLIKTVTH